MTLHKPVIYGPAIEAAQAFAVSSRAMTPPLPALSGVPIKRPFRDALGVTIWFNRTSHLLLREYSHDRSAQARTRDLRTSRRGPARVRHHSLHN